MHSQTKTKYQTRAKQVTKECPKDPKGVDLLDIAIDRIPVVRWFSTSRLVRWLTTTRLFKKLRGFFKQHPDLINIAEGYAAMKVRQWLEKKFEEWAGRPVKPWEHQVLVIVCLALPHVI